MTPSVTAPPAEAESAEGGPVESGGESTQRPAARFHLKKLLFAVHGWLGLSLGLPLFVVCLSGTLAVVSHEIDWLLTPAVRAPAYDVPVNWGAVAASARERYPEGRVTLLTAPVGRGFAAQAWVQMPDAQRRVFADPGTGAVTGETGWFNTQRFFRDFHRRFFWFSAWGITLVSAFSVVLLFSVATGLLFYKRWWAKLFTLRPHKGRRVFWSDLHRLTGVWTLLFAGVIAATGFWYLVEGAATKAIRGGTAAEKEGVGVEGKPVVVKGAAAGKAAVGSKEDRSGAGDARRARLAALGPVAKRLAVEDYVRIAAEAYPELVVRSIWLPARTGEPVRVDGQASAWLVRDRANEVRLDPYTGEVLAVQKAEELPAAVRWIDTADPLHFGDFGGLTSKAVWFGFGLVLSGLIPTGLYLWLKRAEQTAAGVAKRLAQAPGDEVRREIRRATRRRTGLGLAATTAVLGWAAYSTCLALIDELPEPSVRAATESQAVGPWEASAFREGEAPRPGEAAVFGVRFESRDGDANFRRASLALAEKEPGEEGWRVAGGGLDERKSKLGVPETLTGRERLWVSIEGLDGTRSVASFESGAFEVREAPGRQEVSAWAALGGVPVIVFYGGFSALIMVVSAGWYRLAWFPGGRLSKVRAGGLGMR